MIDAVRGVGAIWAVDLTDEDPRTAGDVADALQDRGVIVRPIAPATLALCPPLVITDDEIDTLLDTLASTIGG